MSADITDLRELIANSERLLVFTGAGISTPSGIPDFRGPAGVWTKRSPVYFDEFLASEDKRIEYWEGKLEGWQAFRDAEPNACHRALVELERAGKLAAIVTQNIDGLHQKAGSNRATLFEVHGTNAQTMCLDCDTRDDPSAAMDYFREHRKAPRCECGGLLKPATISFGQGLDQIVLAGAITAAQNADAVLSLGSTLSVHPAASIPLVTAQSGHPYGIVNRGETDHDHLATFKLEADVAEVIPAATEAVLSYRAADTTEK